MAEKKRPDHRGRVIRATTTTNASPERVWEAWADPDKLAQWFPDRAEGRAVEGRVQKWFFDRFGYELPYEVLSAVPGEHLVLTGEPPGRPRFYLEIDIGRAGGTTTVTLTNSGFGDGDGWDEEYEGIVSGWTMSLALLKLYVEQHYGQARSQFFVMRPARYEYSDLSRFYREPELLATWLTRAGAIGGPGERVALTLRDGQAVTGDVLAVTAWEVQLSWAGISGAIALKGFSLGPRGRAVCIHGSGWGLPADRAGALEQQFGEALDRLVTQLEAR